MKTTILQGFILRKIPGFACAQHFNISCIFKQKNHE